MAEPAMSVPASVEAANADIDEIRRGILGSGDQSSALTKSLDSALELLSDQLYQRSTRFLFELIQNADDNTYPSDSLPTMNIHYEDGFLLTSCNEIGFSRQHIEALCQIGQSSKALSGRHIGEKGIGFKSVFKVADIVWVQSGSYSFMFDKSKLLGRMAPIPAKFPNPSQVPRGHTAIRLRLANPSHQAEVIRDLMSLDPQSFLFLRNLRRIFLSVTESSGRRWSTTVERSGEVVSDTPSRVSLHKGDLRMHYIFTCCTAHNLALTPKRPGCTESDIVLAFPILDDEAPVVLPSQFVYTYLPIRDYGFKVCLSHPRPRSSLALA